MAQPDVYLAVRVADAHPSSPIPMPRHLHSLDALRGVAALSVVLWHWQHFFDSKGGHFDPTQQPFYPLLAPFYRQGMKAVELFFCLSGFVFHWLYARRIAEGSVPARSFAVLRLSRLYPLHLFTLIIVAAGEAAFQRIHGGVYLFRADDLGQLLLQLTFTAGWVPGSDGSFNGPAWSVSVEVLLYLIFFVSSRLGMIRWPHMVAFVLVGVALVNFFDYRIGIGVVGFFMGGLAFQAFDVARRSGPGSLKWALACVAIGFVLVPLLHRVDLDRRFSSLICFNLIIFPASVVALALIECSKSAPWSRFAFLGQISYSSYLIHFPLQLGFVLIGSILPALAINSPFYRSPASLLLFFSVLIPFSFASFHWFEKPLQDRLRRLLLAGARPARTGAPAALGPPFTDQNVRE